MALSQTVAAYPLGEESGGAVLYAVESERFKTSRLTAALVLPQNESGAAGNAILPFLMRRSCARYPGLTAMNRKLNELYGADVTADVTLIGDNQAIILGIGSIDDRYALNHEPVAARCAELLCLMLFEPAFENGLFREEDVEQEKRCLAERIRSEINHKRTYARRQCIKLLCEGEGCSVSRYGTEESVDALHPENITAAWRYLLAHSKMSFILQGSGGNAESVAAAISARLPARSPVDTPTLFNRVSSMREQTDRMEINQAKLVLGFRYTGADPAGDLPALRLMNALLGGSPHSLLFKNVREKHSLCYYCASTYDRNKGIMLIDSGVEENMADKAKSEIMRQLEKLCTGDFTDSELESARLSAVNQFLSLGDDQESGGLWYAVQCLDDHVVTPEQAADSLAGVTRGQISEAAKCMTPGAVYILAGEVSA